MIVLVNKLSVRSFSKLLIRPKPYKYESLESYLYRVGFANGYRGLEWIPKDCISPEESRWGLNKVYNKDFLNVLSELPHTFD